MPSHPLTNFETQKYYQNGLDLMVFILKIKDIQINRISLYNF